MTSFLADTRLRSPYPLYRLLRRGPRFHSRSNTTTPEFSPSAIRSR